MSTFIVPNTLRDAINARLDVALAEFPEAVPDRELFYHALLKSFNELGFIPEFTLEKREVQP